MLQRLPVETENMGHSEPGDCWVSGGIRHYTEIIIYTSVFVPLVPESPSLSF